MNAQRLVRAARDYARPEGVFAAGQGREEMNDGCGHWQSVAEAR